jgi:WD40 repeat protein
MGEKLPLRIAADQLEMIKPELGTANRASSVRIWDAASGDCLQTLTGHRGLVLNCGYGPDGRTIVSAGNDGIIRIWDSASGVLRMPVIHTGLDDWAAVDYRANRVVHCGPEAWRHLAWLAPDGEGRITRYPVEIDGPLPIKEC